jgi:hypothetical protein
MEDDEMSKDEQRKLALSEIVLIVLAVIGIAAVIWLGWVRN